MSIGVKVSSEGQLIIRVRYLNRFRQVTGLKSRFEYQGISLTARIAFACRSPRRRPAELQSNIQLLHAIPKHIILF